MVQVKVNEGILEGEIVQNKYGGTFHSFKGIPYAQPPLGDLRFKAPQPPKPWEGVRNAKQFGSCCYQHNWLTGGEIQGSEDCLYLNVYTPDTNPEKPLPVMFWIHGGGYTSGSGEDDFYGPEHLVRQGVILVTINYRLEVLGFLCLNTEDIPGNAGMKDQVQALRWVNKNITSFGGDPNNITIFGESAGAGSVTYHMISPMSKGLFKRVIAQSGVCLNHWAQGLQSRERALNLAKNLGFFSEDDKELYEFFKNQPIEVLINVPVPVTFAEKSVIEKIDVYFGIVDEQKFGDNERFFYGDIIDELSSNIDHGIDIMAGYTSEDGLIMMKPGDYIKDHMEMASNFPEYFISKPLSLTLPVNQQLEMGKKIREFYFKEQLTIPDDWEKLMNFYFADMLWFGIIQFAKIVTKSNRNKLYLYKFSCKSERNVACKMFGTEYLVNNKPVTNHMDDLMYIFEPKRFDLKVNTESDTFQLINKVTKLWTNFAKCGNPTPDDSLGVKWIPYTSEGKDYMDIGNKFVAGTEVQEEEEFKFWASLYKDYGQRVLQ